MQLFESCARQCHEQMRFLSTYCPLQRFFLVFEQLNMRADALASRLLSFTEPFFAFEQLNMKADAFAFRSLSFTTLFFAFRTAKYKSRCVPLGERANNGVPIRQERWTDGCCITAHAL